MTPLDISMYQTTAFSDAANDVRVHHYAYGANGTIAWVDCPSSATIIGEETGAPASYVSVVVQIQELVIGAVGRSGAEVVVELLISDHSYVPALADALMGVEGIFFLRSKSLELQALGASPDVVLADVGLYRPVSSQGMLLSVDGAATAPLRDQTEPEFPRDLVGQPFPTVLSLVESAAG